MSENPPQEQPTMQPPSEQERTLYYYGLTERVCTDPRLVATSSTDPFDDMGYTGAWPGPEPRRKYEFCVGNHPIVGIYDAGPRYQIREALHDIPWQTIDIVRIGTSRKVSNNPVIILVTVPRDSISYTTARDAINRCLEVLAQHDLSDVQVEIKERLFHTTARHNVYDPVPLAVPYEKIPRIGTSLGVGSQLQSENPDQLVASGMLGLYLKIYALACKHVVFTETRPRLDGEDNQRYSQSAFTTAYGMEQPSYYDHKELRKNRKSAKRIDLIYLTELRHEKGLGEKGEGPELTSNQLKRLGDLEKKLVELDERESSVKGFDRKLGDVWATSGNKISGAHQNIQDWALIALDPKRFDTSPVNQLPDVDIRSDLVSICDKLHRRDLPNILALEEPVSTILPFDDLFNIKGKNKYGVPCLRVIKHGRTSGWTGGEVNGLRSDCQRTPGVYSTEICVQNLRDLMIFSHAGDSGSIVFDFKGRIVGMVHGGCARDGVYAMERTYITPMEWLLEDIETQLGVRVSIA